VGVIETGPTPDGAAPVAPTRWRVAPFTPTGLGGWAEPTGASSIAQQATLAPASLVRRPDGQSVALSAKGKELFGSVFDRADAPLPPAIVRAVATTPTTLVVTFDHLLRPEDTVLSGLTVDGVAVADRQLDGVGSRVLLRTAPQPPGAPLAVRAEGVIAGGAPEAAVAGYAPQPLDFHRVSSPFLDAPFVVFDAQDRLISGNAEADGLVALDRDRVTFARIAAPPAPADLAWAVAWRDEVWLSSERRLLQWRDETWTVHDAEEQADPYVTVYQLAAAEDGVWALFWSQTSTRLVRWDGAAWSAPPEPPTPLHAFAVGPDGALVAAGGTCCSYATFNHQLHRFDGAAWTTETLTEGAGGALASIAAMAFAPDGALLIAGTGTTPSGATVGMTAVERDGVVTYAEAPAALTGLSWSPRLIPSPAGPPVLISDGLATYADGVFTARQGFSRVKGAAFDAYGFLWTVHFAASGYTGQVGLQFHGPLGP
jgi:hypothetical protein